MFISYVNGVCGSGKTQTAIRKIAEKVAAEQTVIYATDTLLLLEQTKSGLENLGVACELIVASEQSEWRRDRASVVVKILKSISAADGEARVILCTTRSLVRAASRIPADRRMTLYIDEGFVVVDGDEIINLTASESQGLLAKLKLAKEKPDGFDDRDYKFSEKMKTLVQYAENQLMVVDAKAVGSKLHWNAYLDLPAFCSKFSEVTLLAACHEDTLQYHAFKAAGIEQVALDWGLATEHVTNGQVHIAYVLENTEWRTTLKNKLTDAELEEIALAFEREHWDPFINVNRIGDEGLKISVKSHGFNNYSHLNHFMDLHTQMPIPSLAKFYEEKLGMTEQDIRRACYHYDRYQGALRTSLRNSKPNNLGTEDLFFCFGDKCTADYFASKLAPSVKFRIYKLPIELSVDSAGKATYSNKVSDSPAEQKARSRDRAKLNELNPNMNNLNEALIFLRDYRRENPNKRVTKELYQSVANDFL